MYLKFKKKGSCSQKLENGDALFLCASLVHDWNISERKSSQSGSQTQSYSSSFHKYTANFSSSKISKQGQREDLQV